LGTKEVIITVESIKPKFFEKLIQNILKLTAGTTILVLFLIFFFLLKEGYGIFSYVSLRDFILGTQWLPETTPPKFGALPLIKGSLYVTVGATLIAVPIGISVAVFLAEAAPPMLREVLKAVIELLAGIPSVVYGFLGLTILAPFIKELFNLSSALCAFTASIVLALMSLPTIVSISEDVLTTVPKEYREASLALGATKWETTLKIVIPAARTGLIAAAMLGIGRAIGETMAVLMVAGNAVMLPHSFFDPVRTITANIAAEMGETVHGGLHYQALFGLGIVLFVITFIINFLTNILAADKLGMKRGKYL